MHVSVYALIRSFLLFLIFALPLGIFASEAQAVILTGALTGGSAFSAGGTFEKLTPPIGDVGDDNHQSNNLFGFDEDQNIVLASPLSVDIGPSSTLASGTEVASHYVFFDPVNSETAVGYVEFDSEVLAIMTSTENLDDSDFLANVSANYLSPNLRGLESVDNVNINSSNAKRIDIDFRASSPGDYIRVLTERSEVAAARALVPEPSTLALFGVGLAGLGAARRRR